MSLCLDQLLPTHIHRILQTISVKYQVDEENFIRKINLDRNYKYLNKITNGETSVLDKKIIGPVEVVELDESDDDGLASSDPSDGTSDGYDDLHLVEYYDNEINLEVVGVISTGRKVENFRKF